MQQELTKKLLVKNIIIPNQLPNSINIDLLKKTRSVSPTSPRIPFKQQLIAKCVRQNQNQQVIAQVDDNQVKKIFIKAEKGFQILPKIPINTQPPLHSPQSIELIKDHLITKEEEDEQINFNFMNTSNSNFQLRSFKTSSIRSGSKSPSPLRIRRKIIDSKQEKEEEQQNNLKDDAEFIQNLIQQVDNTKQSTQNEMVIQRRKQINLYQKLKPIQYKVTENELFAMYQSNHGSLRPQFKEEYFYFNKGASPYDLKLTSFEKKNHHKYYTISSHGILIYNDGDEQFLSIERFQNEKKNYFKIRNIQFFKQFLEWKVFQRWKRLMRKQVMQKCRETIESKLFILNTMFRKSILKIRAICLELSQTAIINTFYMQSISSVDIKIFLKFQINYLKTAFLEKIQELSLKISNIISSSCKNSLQQFTQAHQIQSISEASYTQQAVLTFEYKQLTNFIRFVDFLHTDSKSYLMCEGISSIIKMIDNMSHGREVGGKVKIYGFLEKEDNGGEKLYPSKEYQQQIFEDIIKQSCEITVDIHQYFFLEPVLKEYIIIDFFENKQINHLEMKSEMKQNITNSLEYKHNFQKLQTILDFNYKNIENKCSAIEILRQLYTKYQPIQSKHVNYLKYYSSLEKYEAKEFSQLFDVFLQDKKILYEVEAHMDIGFYSLDHSQLIDKVKEQLKVFYKTSFTAIEEKIDQMACVFFEKVKQHSKMIYNYPETIEQYHQFFISYEIIDKQRESDSNQMQRILDLSQVCASKKVILSGQLKQLLSQTIYSYGELDKKLSDISANMDSLLFKYKQTLEKQINFFKIKANTFINKNLTYLQVHRDLLDVNFIMQRLTEELQKDFDYLDGIKKSIQVTQNHLDIDQKSHAEFSFYDLHKIFLWKTEKFWMIVRHWLELQNNFLHQHYSKLESENILIELEEVLQSKQQNQCKIADIQEYMDLDVQNSEVTKQLFQFLLNMSNTLKVANELKTFLSKQKDSINNQINIIINNQQQKLFPDLEPFQVAQQEDEISYSFIKKYQLFNFLDEFLQIPQSIDGNSSINNSNTTMNNIQQIQQQNSSSQQLQQQVQ